MSNVIPLDGRRTPPTGVVQSCEQCGCVWFRLVIADQQGLVAFDRHGAVVAHAGIAVCRECGTEHETTPVAR